MKSECPPGDEGARHSSDRTALAVIARSKGNLMRVKIGLSQAGCCLMWFATGCSVAPSPDYGKVTLLSVSGTVTLDGKPLPGAVVTFDAPDGQFSFGLTDSAGAFSLRFDSVKSGA